MRILEIAILACILALLIVLLVSILCYTRLRLAEVKAAPCARPGDGPPTTDPEAPKPAPGSVDEGIENIMTYGVGEKKGDSL